MAVYTLLSKHDIQGFLAHYRVGELASATGIAEGIDNTNYLVSTSLGRLPQRHILTVFEQRLVPQDIHFFMQLTEWLASHGIPCPYAIKGKNGASVHILKGKPAALVQFLDGKNNPHVTDAHVELVGRLAAHLHLAAEGFPHIRRNPLSLDGWRQVFRGFRYRADEIAAGLERDLENELEFLSRYWPQSLPSGVVHTDLFPDNIFFQSDALGHPRVSGVIDFYFACNDFWMYDLAITMNAWCFDSEYNFLQARAQALFAAYGRVRGFTEAEKQALPVLARGASVRFLLTRAHDWLNRIDSALVVPKNPKEYMEKLKFHQQVEDYRDYGLA